MSIINEKINEPRVFGWQRWLLIILLLIVAAFLLLPLGELPLADWVVTLQTSAHQGLNWSGPFALVVVLGILIGLAEVTSTFPNYPREALRTRWARTLVMVNAAAATLAFVIVQSYTSTSTNPLLLAVGVGLGFQTLIRTKFTLARGFGGSSKDGEVSINLGWLYDQFQALCKTQIDLELMNGRQSVVTHLVSQYPSPKDLFYIAEYTLAARATLTEEEERAQRDLLKSLFSEDVPPNIVRSKIALFILETGGEEYVHFMLRQMEHEPESVGPAGVLGQLPEDVLVSQLIERQSLVGLVALTRRLTRNRALIEWVEQAAQPAAEVSEAQQKATIGYRLVREVGVEAVRQALGED